MANQVLGDRPELVKKRVEATPLEPYFFIQALQRAFPFKTWYPFIEKPVVAEVLVPLLDLIGVVLTPRPLRIHDDFTPFATAVEQYLVQSGTSEVEHDSLLQIYRAIVQQLSALLRHIEGEDIFDQTLAQLLDLVRSPTWKKLPQCASSHVLLAFTRIPASFVLWGHPTRSAMAAQLLAQLIPEPFEFNGEWDDWWARMLPGFEKLLAQTETSDELTRHAVVENAINAAQSREFGNIEKLGPELLNQLNNICSIHIRFIASRVFQSANFALTTLPLPDYLARDPTWHRIVSSYSLVFDNISKESNVALFRAIILTGPRDIYASIEDSIARKLYVCVSLLFLWL